MQTIIPKLKPICKVDRRFTGGQLDVTSTSDLNLYNIAGAVQVAGNVGIGASAAINKVSRDTLAIIGNLNAPVADAATLIDVSGLKLNSKNKGNIVSAAVSGVVADKDAAESLTDNTDASDIPIAVGVAGAVSYNKDESNSLSLLNDPSAIKMSGNDVVVDSQNATRIIAVTGSLSLAAQAQLSAGWLVRLR